MVGLAPDHPWKHRRDVHSRRWDLLHDRRGGYLEILEELVTPINGFPDYWITEQGSQPQ